MISSSHSRASDTSSAYSGSDIMQSSTNGDENNDTDDESDESEEVKKIEFFFSFLYFNLKLFYSHYLFVIMYEKH